MKKVLFVFVLLFMLCGCNSVISSNNDIILPLFSSDSNTQNKIWIGTFQLVFNDMKKHVLKKDIYFVNEKPTDELKGLNNEEFNSSMLNDSSYYTSYGETSTEARDKIKQAIKQKFNETSALIDSFDWSRAPGKYYAYAMLKKQFEFINEFDKIGEFKFNNSDKNYSYFGIENNSSDILDKNVKVLFYNNEDDYAVSLLTKTNDEIYLYRTDDNKSLEFLYNDMRQKEKDFKGDKFFKRIDTIKIPNMKFKKIHSYKELCNKLIKGTNFYFSDAIETLEFELDNKGGKVKSEAIIMMEATAAFGGEKPKPRHFNFDKTFNMFLIDYGKNNPYMALRVSDLSDFQN